MEIRSACNADGPAIRRLVFGVLEEYGLPCAQDGVDRDLADIESFYRAPGVFEVLVDRHDQIVGTVGLLAKSQTVCELRKMYLAKSVRQQGWGKQLLERIINTAKRAGFEHMELETASVLQAATRLYESYGFKPFDGMALSERCSQAYTLDLRSRT